MGCRIGGVRLVGGDSGANPGAHYISRSLERFFIIGEHILKINNEEAAL